MTHAVKHIDPELGAPVCRMDLPGGPECFCGSPSAHQYGLCDEHSDAERLERDLDAWLCGWHENGGVDGWLRRKVTITAIRHVDPVDGVERWTAEALGTMAQGTSVPDALIRLGRVMQAEEVTAARDSAALRLESEGDP